MVVISFSHLTYNIIFLLFFIHTHYLLCKALPSIKHICIEHHSHPTFQQNLDLQKPDYLRNNYFILELKCQIIYQYKKILKIDNSFFLILPLYTTNLD